MHDAGWYSYPSGHAALAPIVFGLAAVLWIGGIAPSRRVVRLGAVATLTGAIALSRVYLGLHYPSDVAGGLLLGIGWSFLWLSGRAYAGLAAATEEPLLER
jgi:undecaprenyl-diphosphatase